MWIPKTLRPRKASRAFMFDGGGQREGAFLDGRLPRVPGEFVAVVSHKVSAIERSSRLSA